MDLSFHEKSGRKIRRNNKSKSQQQNVSALRGVMESRSAGMHKRGRMCSIHAVTAWEAAQVRVAHGKRPQLGWRLQRRRLVPD
jgi:hypothetical protein